MKIHEFQAKEFLQKYGVSIPKGKVAHSVEEALQISNEMNFSKCVVKAQIHAGGRGIGGGVKFCKNRDEIKKNSKNSNIFKHLISKLKWLAGELILLISGNIFPIINVNLYIYKI